MPSWKNIQCQISNAKYQICLVITLSLFILTGCVSPSFAQTPVTTQNTQNVVDSLLNSVAGCMIAGKSLIAGEPCQNETAFPTTSQSSLLQQKSALGFIGLGISSVSSPPLSSREALADMGSALGFAKPAYAQNVQGSGANIIAPVKTLWQIIRNMSYMFYILLFLVVGLMLMFRQKMNPQTVISVQAALPGLIIGLVLITFSYLIAALLVDLAFLFIPMVAIIFEQASPTNIFINSRGLLADTPFANYKHLIEVAQNANIFTFWTAFTKNIVLYDFFGNTPQSWSFNVTDPLGSLIKGLVELGKNGLNLFIAVVVIFALFIQMVRLLALLVRSYITIMVYTFLGPFFILMASVPGRGKGLSDWWKTILANSLVFPAVFAGFFFGGMFFNADIVDQTQFQYTMPFFSGLPVQVIKYIIGLMIILGVPALPGMVKEALGVKDIKGIPEVAMAGFGSGGEVVSKGIKKYTGYDSIMKQREALKEGILRNKYSSTEDLAHLSRPGWLGGYTERFVTALQPSYVKSAIGKASDAQKAQTKPQTSST